MKKNLYKSTLGSNYIIYFICISIILVTLSLFNISVFLTNNRSTKKPNVLGAETTEAAEIYFWQDFLTYNPQYLEGWLQIAQLEYKRGNLEAAKKAIINAENINPNSAKVKTIKEVLRL